MDLYEYVERYKNLTFEEKPFNDVEAAIFITLSYAKFENIIPSITEKKTGIVIKDFSDEQIIELSSPKTLGLECGKLIELMREAPRYRDILIENSMNVFDSDTSEQFFAVTFNIPFIGLFIAFRGTDGSLIGWKENLSILYNQATLAQLDAVEYLYQISDIHKEESFMIGGHSKGGNLAMYDLFFAPEELNKKISKAYSFDGYGFTSKKFRSLPNYDELISRFVQIVPKESIIGELFYTPFNYIVIDAFGKGLAQHHPFSWKLDDEGEFVQIPIRSFKTRLFHRVAKKWSQFSSRYNYKIFAMMITSAFQGKDGEFAVYGEDSKHKLRKMRKATRKLSFKERLTVMWLFIVLGWITFTSIIYYIVMSICIVFGMKRHKHRGIK